MLPEMTEPKMLTNWPKPTERVTKSHRFDKMLPKEVFLHYIAHTRALIIIISIVDTLHESNV